MKLNGQPIEIVEKFCYPRETKGTRVGINDSAIVKISKGCSKFRNWESLLSSAGFWGAVMKMYLHDWVQSWENMKTSPS